MRNFQIETVEEFNKQVKNMSRDMVKALQTLLKEVEKQAKYDRTLVEGLKGMIFHLEHGGKVKTSTLPKEANANELFKAMLKENGVMFASFTTKNPDTETFITKDKDSYIIENIRNRLYEKLSLMRGEMSPKDLMEKYDIKDVKMISGLEMPELEHFRQKIKKNTDYAITDDIRDPGKFMLVYPKSALTDVENTLNKVIFDFSGKDGHEMRNKFDKCIKARERLIKNIKKAAASGKKIILADSINPATFIRIDKTGISLHSLKYEIDNTADNKGNERIIDEKIQFDDLSKLSVFMDKLINPVIISEQEYSLIKGFDNKGNVIADPETFYEDLDSFKAKILNMPPSRKYTAGYELFKLNNPMMQDIHTFAEIPDNVIEKFSIYAEANELKETVISENYIACTDKDKSEIDEFMQKNVYQSYMPDENASFSPVVEYEARFLHENRGNLIISDVDKMPEKQFIVDGSNLCFLFEITPDGLKVYNSSGTYLDTENNYSRDEQGNIIRDDEFDKTLLTILNNMENPLLLDTSDVLGKSSEDILQAIYERRGSFYENPAIDKLRELMLKGNDTEFEEIFTVDESLRTEKQAEAYEKITAYRETAEKEEKKAEAKKQPEQAKEQESPSAEDIEIDINL